MTLFELAQKKGIPYNQLLMQVVSESKIRITNGQQSRNAVLAAVRKVAESATAGATSAASIASVPNPAVAIGRDRTKKSYTGSPGKSGTKAPKLPTVSQPKNPDGTAKNGLDINANLFGSGTLKRNG